MIPFKNLMIGVTNHLHLVIYKARAQGKVKGLKLNCDVDFFKNSPKSFELTRHVGSDEVVESLGLMFMKILGQQIEVFVEGRLRRRLKRERRRRRKKTSASKLNSHEPAARSFKFVECEKQFFRRHHDT